MKNLSQNSWCPSLDSNRIPTEYKSMALLLHQLSWFLALIWAMTKNLILREGQQPQHRNLKTWKSVVTHKHNYEGIQVSAWIHETYTGEWYWLATPSLSPLSLWHQPATTDSTLILKLSDCIQHWTGTWFSECQMENMVDNKRLSILIQPIWSCLFITIFINYPKQPFIFAIFMIWKHNRIIQYL
jgi:hypothetical protein